MIALRCVARLAWQPNMHGDDNGPTSDKEPETKEAAKEMKPLPKYPKHRTFRIALTPCALYV